MSDDLHGRLADTAAAYLAAGFSVVPARADASKAPFGRWRDYWQRRATETTLRTMLATGQYDGLGIVCGAISGNAEMLELEGRAVAENATTQLREQLTHAGHGDLLDRLAAGHLETTPSGGLHFLYRVEGEDVPGNLKLARRPSTPDELAAWKAQQQADIDRDAADLADDAARAELHRRQEALDRITDGAQVPQVLIETRGEHGFTVTAPSAGRTHPTGRAWQLVAGGPATVPTITAEERTALHDACRALDTMPTRENTWSTPTIAGTAGTSTYGAPSKGAATAANDARPGDDYNNRATWPEILEPHGWHRCGTTRNGGTEWTRPGKDHGPSATTGVADDADRLYVFTSSTLFEPNTPYSKFAAYAMLEHGGRHDLAAAALRRAGYGATTPHDHPRTDPFVGLVHAEGEAAWTASTPAALTRTSSPATAATAATATPPTSPPGNGASSTSPGDAANPAAGSAGPPSTSPSAPTSTPAASSTSSSGASPGSGDPCGPAKAPTDPTSTTSARTTATTAETTSPATPAAGAGSALIAGTGPGTPPGPLPSPERSSWWPRDLTAILDGQDDEPQPAQLARQDGHRLLYAGKVNGLIGESESGKTWVGLLAVLQALQVGERCLVLDFEDTAPGIVARLRDMGASDTHLARLAYIGPDEALHAAATSDLQEALEAHRPAVILLDGVNAAMTLLGLDLESNTDATKFAQRLLTPLARTGACVAYVDHVPKRKEDRGKGGIGAQAKRAMTSGTILRVEVVDEFGRGMVGRLSLTVDKDRAGHVRAVSANAKNAGTVVIDSRATGTARVTVEAPDMRPQREVDRQRADAEQKRHAELVSKYLENCSDRPSTSRIVKAMGVREADTTAALRWLEDRGHVASEDRGSGRPTLWQSLSVYRFALEGLL